MLQWGRINLCMSIALHVTHAPQTTTMALWDLKPKCGHNGLSRTGFVSWPAAVRMHTQEGFHWTTLKKKNTVEECLLYKFFFFLNLAIVQQLRSSTHEPALIL